MGLARDLVELEKQLRERDTVDPFLPIGQSGVLSSPECAEMTERLIPAASLEPAALLHLCLQVLRIQHDLLRHRLLDAELVATLPPGTPGIARPTKPVVREMVGRATSEVILLGYEFNDSSTVQLLGGAAARGADVVIICDRGRGAAARIRDAWPPRCRPPRLFHNREQANGAPYASMHAKCLLVDGEDFLVTSANFTFHGLHGNIEMGIRLAGSPAAEARKIFSYLVESGVLQRDEDD
ncbi:MAG: phospholipase D-like domain-containing protein [Dehalococcoidia bacterium]